MKSMFAPVATDLYKPALVQKVHATLEGMYGPHEIFTTCCMNKPQLEAGVEIINILSGCDSPVPRKITRVHHGFAVGNARGNDVFRFPDYARRHAVPTPAPCAAARNSRGGQVLLRQNEYRIKSRNTPKIKSVCCATPSTPVPVGTWWRSR